MHEELQSSALVIHHDQLCRAARRMCGSPEDADDLVQDTYVRVLHKPRPLESRQAALGYLLRALHNTHVSRLRRGERRPQTAPLPHDHPTFVVAAATSPASALFIRELLRALAALPDRQRHAVTAVDVIGFSYTEAADALGIPVGTVMSRLHRGRGRIATTMAA